MATHATADGDGGGDGRADTGHTDAADGADVTDSVRPALIKLTEDLRDERDRLLAGFASRRAVLEWAQRLTVRTMGRLPQQWYVDLADQFTGVSQDARQRTFLAALLSDAARDRDLDPDAAAEYREQLAGNLLRQAQHDAFRHLRVSANEYTDVDESAQNPLKQRYIAMRPALNELDRNQTRTIDAVLSGFEDRAAILAWGDDLELATHGQIEGAFIRRCYAEDSTVANLLCADGPTAERGRELFAATYLLPVFNEGVRDLLGFSAESAEEEHQPVTRDELPMG